MLGGNDGTETPPPTVSTAGTAPELLPRRTAGPRRNRRMDGAVLTKNRCFRGKYGARAEKRPIPAVRPPAGGGRSGRPPSPAAQAAGRFSREKTDGGAMSVRRNAAEKMRCALSQNPTGSAILY